MKRISIQDLKATLSAAVADAEAGQTVVITRHNRGRRPAHACHADAHARADSDIQGGDSPTAAGRHQGPLPPGAPGGSGGRSVTASSADRPSGPRAVSRHLGVPCVLLGEQGAGAIASLTQGAVLVSSVLLVLEARRNIVRLARMGALKSADYKACLDRLDEDQKRFVLRDLTLDLCQSNVLPAVTTPRSLDLAHLRTALGFNQKRRSMALSPWTLRRRRPPEKWVSATGPQ